MATGDTAENRLERAKQQLQKGQFKEALQEFQNARLTDPDNKEIQILRDRLISLKKEEDVINRYMENKLHIKALGHIDAILNHAKDCARVKLLKAECFVRLNRCDEAVKLLNDIGDCKESADTKMELIYVKAIIQYNRGDIKKALDIASEGMKIDKSHPKVKQIFFRAKYLQNQLKEAETAVENKNYQEARFLYNEVAETIHEENKTGEYDRILAKILLRKVETSIKMQAFIDAIADCERVISYEEFLDEAYAHLADAHSATGGMDIASKVLQKSLENEKLDKKTRATIEAKLDSINLKKEDQPLKLLQEVLDRVKAPKTPREIANVNAEAQFTEVDNNLKKLLARYSPDQYANKPESHKKVAAEIFKVVSNAKEELKSEQKREETVKAKHQDLKNAYEKMNSWKTPRQAAGKPEDTAKDEIVRDLKNLIKKYHPDSFKTPELKPMADELFKKIRELQEMLDKEKAP